MELAGKYRPFADALRSEVGRELLRDVMVKMEILLEAIIQDKPPKKMTMDQVKAEYRVLRDILNRWSEKVHKYDATIQKMKEAI
jgi:hypothetical protein